MYDGYPLHRLNSAMMLAWLMYPVIRRQMASWMGKNYRTGVVVLSPTLYAIATVTPTGSINPLAPPFKQFEFWQIDNKPSLKYSECACRNFWDPESEGPWGLRDKERGRDIHHPFCQGRQSAVKTWGQAKVTAEHNLEEKKKAQSRPDEWIRIARDIEG
jgi:hypothetical protein